MKIKKAEGVQQVQMVSLKPMPLVYVSYDGLSGLSVRPILRDIMEEIERGAVRLRESKDAKGAPVHVSKKEFITSLKKNGSGRVYVYFNDYVSYGEGAGEEIAEFYYKSMLLLYRAGSPESGEGGKALLQHAQGSVEEIPLSPE